MADDTILVIDADSETEEQIVSVLEAENYLVFTASAPEVRAGLAGRISPSLIFLKPTAASADGFQACKAIHAMEAFRNVPIVLLAALKEPMDSRYTTYYGIIDFLKMPLDADEVLKKTEKILGAGRRNPDASDEESGLSEEVASQEGTGRTEEEYAPAYVSGTGSSEHLMSDEFGKAEESGRPAWEKEDFADEDAADTEEEEHSGMEEPDENGAYHDLQESFGAEREGASKKRSVLIAAVITVSLIATVAAGYLGYTFFIAAPKGTVSTGLPPRAAVEKQAPAVVPPQEQQTRQEPLAGAVPEASKEVPQDKPAAASEAKPSGKPVYSVQLGAFRSEGGAASLAKSLKGRGYEAFTQKGTTRANAAVHRVLIGEYEDRKDALRAADKIRTQEKIETTVFAWKAQ